MIIGPLLLRAAVDDILWRFPDAKVELTRSPESGDYVIRARISKFMVVDPVRPGQLERDWDRLVQVQE